ncbi:MAG: AbgT family transporter [Phenylobacterium sp.]|uniref:AbgT family transporter n=1 Tax=Phenylobacterium sp. TaxID=1871053 RepID=UPI00391D66C1
MTRKTAVHRALDAIERLGDRLPDPVFIFFWIIGALVAASMICAWAGVSAINPVNGEVLQAKSLVAPDNVRTLLVEMPKTLTGFAPLGYVLLIMLGAGVAERTGLLSAAIRVMMRASPPRLVTPMVILLGLLSNHAADSGFVILLPLAGAAFAAVGRHPIAGIAAAFAGVVGSFAGNPLPGQFDALILGLSEPAARLIDADWTANLAGDWWFTAAGAVVFVPVAWWVTVRIVEPRLGPWEPAGGLPAHDAPLLPEERRGLVWAGLAALTVVALWAALTLAPGAPLVDHEAEGPARWTPFFRSLVAGFFVLFLAGGVAYGRANGTIRSDRDVVRLASESMAAMAPYIVLAFAAAHFIAMFTWSNLGVILAIHGADALRASGLPIPVLMMAIVLLTAGLDMLIGSASAKWAALAPVLVPMLMLVGVSPEMTTAAYRMGDSTVNMASPLMPYFGLVLGFCQRWRPGFGVGGLISAMLPYSAAMMAAGMLMTGAWAMLELPTGPGAPVHYSHPGELAG